MGDHGQYYYRGIKEVSEFEEIQKWVNDHSDLVFIRSLFDTAIATCEHFNSNNTRSPIGELEHAAKYEGNGAAAEELVGILKGAFVRVHQALGVSALISVPSSTKGVQSLPNHLTARLSQVIGIPDLTSGVCWDGQKSKIKELAVAEKWTALEKVGLTAGDAIHGQNILLIDDMYQSGATAHFVASRLRAAGANDLHMLAVSKGRRDTDNT